MRWFKKFIRNLTISDPDNEHFLKFIHRLEVIVSKILSLLMIGIIFVSLFDLVSFLVQQVFSPPTGFFNRTLFEIFGLFLNVLIALELLENITAYLQRNVIHVELVIVTSLIAVARKVIIFDLEKKQAIDLIALALTILALSISYLLIRLSRIKDRP
ncbi:phosphate-starvation-inducible PsiE family protein [Kamptonema cortianum]|uniref:Phosphate-starvation-inducible PsiE family protein n=1 Tax=Geitlerinema calcuttense NRMC-F 0142 TaxID=2922238 RepID=A0ABT7LXP1_9CYAN|nr:MULTISPECIES: phosphate-starvation-inducible PsiE family protein [Cyanophyceae]MCD8487375.1 phosphate-starvation-inducible PsiE family protein [Desertifilum sp.]MDI9640339.1 phosphate-starvation-inducible PsiE family protein [Geitlerinema splendidum]MDK3159202.1 phosphate-starvation-inducible PsiE family protein [Kamptonema cortianum]MDL5044782.1 phosphate-starvation-inducible PsiE family protein [Oscillatoria amoena NRMC-F 0135]MDL5052137.1 phosphate-starvation-inducible PsiE family protei